MSEKLKRLKVKDNPIREEIEIEGVKYSYYFFTGMGHKFKLNTPFVIVERKDGIVTIDEYKQSEK